MPLKCGDFQVGKGELGFVEGQNDEEAAGEQARVRDEGEQMKGDKLI